MNIPQDLLYTKDHEWVRIENDFAVVGITDFAQGELGDIVFVQLPEKGARIAQGQPLGTIEAVKAVADIYSPLSGEVIEVNSALGEKPELMNQHPYDGGWVVKLRPSNLASEKPALLSAAAYADLTTA
jgi:glycine cleavage system H protein